MKIQARDGYVFFMTFIDDYSKYEYICWLHHKSNVIEKFKEFKAEKEKRHGIYQVNVILSWLRLRL